MDDGIISLEDYKKLKKSVKFMPEADVRTTLYKLIGITMDLVSHVESISEDLRATKRRQLQLATILQELTKE